MKNSKPKDDTSFRRWLSAWYQSIHELEVTEGADSAAVDYQDIVIKGNLPRLTALLQDEAFPNLLARAYGPLRDKVHNTPAQWAVREFLMNACWICRPSLNSVPDKKDNSTPTPGDLKKDWLNLNKASVKLAKQIEALSPSFGPDSSTYLEARLQAGNPVGYIFNRKHSRHNAIPQQPTRRLSELLRCFASDIEEEAALLGIQIEGHRQKGGAQAGLHFAMDSLTSASLSLSAVVPAKPNFALVNRVIELLLDPVDGFDSSTARRRYLAAVRRKTRA
jgi:hypothetical protein